jgi:hypothetical protein
MAAKNVETHRAAHAAWERRDFDGAVSGMVDSFTYEDHAAGRSLASREDFKEYIAGWAKAFSDGKISEGAQFVLRGTNDGGFGPFAATGRQVSLAVCELIHFDSTGRIVSGGVYYDQLSLLVQLGHAQPPPGQ